MDNLIKTVLFFAAVIGLVVFFGNFYFGNLFSPQGGFFISQDKAATWSRSGVLATEGNINRLDIIDIKNNPKDYRIVYANTLHNGILKSVDAGMTWHKLSDQNSVLSPRANVYSIAVDPMLPDYKNKKPDKFYLGVSQDSLGKVLKTEDGGVSFKEVYVAAKPQVSVFAVEIDPVRPNIIWAGTGEGVLLKSQDYGETWNLAQEFGQAIKSVLINPKNTGQMFVATFNGSIFTSADAGTNWTDDSEGLKDFNGARSIQSVVFNPVNGGMYLASGFGLLKSLDFGISWEPIYIISPDSTLAVSDVAFGPSGAQEIYVSASNLIYSTKDGGKFWQVRKLGTVPKIRALWVNPKDGVIIAGAGSGALK